MMMMISSGRKGSTHPRKANDILLPPQIKKDTLFTTIAFYYCFLLALKSKLNTKFVSILREASSVKETSKDSLDTSSQDMRIAQSETTLIVNLCLKEGALVKNYLGAYFDIDAAFRKSLRMRERRVPLSKPCSKLPWHQFQHQH